MQYEQPWFARYSACAVPLTMVLCFTACSTPRVTEDRPDEVSGPQVHVIYAIPSDGTDRRLDMDGTLEKTVGSFQNWLQTETKGRKLRMDTFQGGKLDITFIQLDRTDAVMKSLDPYIRDEIERELTNDGFLQQNKLYAAYYDGSSGHSCGGGAFPPTLPGRLAATYLQGTPPTGPPCNTNSFAATSTATPRYAEYSMLHELLHTLGYVDVRAPNHVVVDAANNILPGHVSGDRHDLMWAGLPGPNGEGWTFPAKLDIGGNDYYGTNVPSGVQNFMNSPFLEPQGTLCATSDRCCGNLNTDGSCRGRCVAVGTPCSGARCPTGQHCCGPRTPDGACLGRCVPQSTPCSGYTP